MTLDELRKKRADLWESAKKILHDHSDEYGILHDSALIEYDFLSEEVKMLGAQIKRMETAQRIIVFHSGELAFYKCPTCKTILSVRTKKEEMSYCWHCDQKLDWGTEE